MSRKEKTPGSGGRGVPVRHAVALGLLAGVVLSAYQLAATAGPTVASLGTDDTFEFFGIDPSILTLGQGYDLASLKNYRRTSDYVRQQYVDPARIDYPAGFAASLDAVERSIPEVLLRLDPAGQQLRIEVGDYAETLTVRPLGNAADVVEELRRVVVLLDTHLADPKIERPDIEYALINGMLSTLDPHSLFLPPESSQKMEEDNEGAFGGLGIQIKLDKLRRLMVEVPLEDTPAWRAGIQAGDRILKIDGEGTLNMDLDESVKKMRGVPGTSITLTIDREGFASPRDYTIVRARINQNPVWGKLLPGKIGYIRIEQFHGQVETQLDAVLAQLGTEAGKGGVQGIVLDLRDNPGGFLHQAVAVSDRFLASGVIVSTVGRDAKARDSSEATPENDVPEVPIAVLTSGNSASASEIVAGALKNSGRAIILGERTFGKGSVQNLYPFADTSRLKLTIARYLTPGDHSIQGIGIGPDVALERAFVLPPKEVEISRGGVSSKVQSSPTISLFSRDRLQREADLAGHFVETESADPEPTMSLRYLYAPDDSQQRTDRDDVTRDVQVMVARDVLAAAKGWRRADVLRTAAPVVQARAKAEAQRIASAFQQAGIGIDWSTCEAPAQPQIDLRLVVGEDGKLDAGAIEPVTVEATNRGSTPVCQTVGVVKSGNGELDGAEFYFGRIAPGETRRYSLNASLADGYPTETAALSVRLTDPLRHTLGALETTLETRSMALPSYAFRWTASDAEGGNGNGILELGETVTLSIDASNTGAGAGGVAHFLLKKDPGMRKAVDIKRGAVDMNALAPGASASGSLSFRVVERPEDGIVRLELRTFDDERYDYGSIAKGGFWDWFDQSVHLELPIGTALPTGTRSPPRIEITRAPEAIAATGEVTLSGTVTDDTGLRDIILYRGEEKIGYEGGAGGTLKQVPFSATTSLKDGVNLLVVLARDADGIVSTRSIPVYKPVSVAVTKP